MKNIKDIMSTEVSVVAPSTTIMEVASKMDELDVGAMPVCDNDRLVGMITDRDIVIRSVSAGQDPRSATCGDSMTAPVTTCFEDQSIDEIAQMMKDKQIRRVAVLNRDKRLVGIVTLGDLAVEGRERNLTADVTEKVSEPVKKAA